MWNFRTVERFPLRCLGILGSVTQAPKSGLIGGGRGVHWPRLDEDISAENLILGKWPSPDLATPQQTREWKDCKGIYRFMNNDKVTVEKIIETHCRRTRSHARTGVWLSICDTTEVDYTSRKDVEGLGPIGNGIGRGFMLHSSIFVAAESDEIVGLGGQELFYRKPKPANDNSQRRKKAGARIGGLGSSGRPSWQSC